MRVASLLVFVAAVIGCGQVTEEQVYSKPVLTGVAPVEVAEAESSDAPPIAEMPEFEPGSVLNQKLGYLREDLVVKLSVSIDQSGSVIATELTSVSPPEHSLAVEFGDYMTEWFGRARFQAPKEYTYPHSFGVTVQRRARKDAAGRLE